MTAEPPTTNADSFHRVEPAKPMEPEALAFPSHEEFQFPTATLIAMGIAAFFVGLIVVCSGVSLLEMASPPPDHFAGLITGYSVMGLLAVAGASLFLVLIEFRRRLFLIVMGAALGAVALLGLIAFFVYR
ncbi:MAG TPA: hypothetical protein VGN57_07550 [Pirellulaceae bacterium]|nr:hypothetical protein [Pirellulaceae bacterium]